MTRPEKPQAEFRQERFPALPTAVAAASWLLALQALLTAAYLAVSLFSGASLSFAVGSLGGLVVTVALIVYLRQGRRGARIVLTILTVIIAIPLLTAAAMSATGPTQLGVTLGAAAISVATLVFVYLPTSNRFFSATAAAHRSAPPSA